MKSIVSWTLFCLFSFLVITSCQKENIDTVVETEETVTPTTTTIAPPPSALLGRASAASQSTTEAEADGLNLDCIEIIFPLNLVDSEGTTYEVTNEEGFNALLTEAWDTTLYIVDFEYPISVSLNDGEVIVVEESEQLGELFAECVPDGGWDELIFPAYLIDDENSCYKIVYPISLEDAVDGTIITVADEAAFIEVLVEKEVYFHFPINLTDGETVFSIANVDELFNTLFSCNEYYEDSTAWDWEGGFEYIGCFQVNFPMTIVVADGGEKVVNNHEELCELMLQGELVDYAYPLTLTSPEGEDVLVNSAEALEELLWQCDQGIPVDSNSDLLLLLSFSQPFDVTDSSACYTINFPIEVTYYNEDYTTRMTGLFNSAEEIWAIPTAYGNGESPGTEAELVYPLAVTRTADNQTLTLNNFEEIMALVEACLEGLGDQVEGNPGINGDSENDLLLLAIYSQPMGEDSTNVCYTINFPINGFTIDVNGNTQTVVLNSLKDIFDRMINGDVISVENNYTELVYPVDITQQSDGQVITLNTSEDLFELVEACSGE